MLFLKRAQSRTRLPLMLLSSMLPGTLITMPVPSCPHALWCALVFTTWVLLSQSDRTWNQNLVCWQSFISTRLDGWKVCKDAFQLLASAFVHSVECAVSLQGCFSASCFCTSALLRLASVWKKKQTVHPIHLPLTGWIPSMHSNSVHVNVCAEYEASVSWVYYNTKSSFLFLLNPWTHPYRHP